MEMEWQQEVGELNKAMSTLIEENEKLRRNFNRRLSMVSVPSLTSLANLNSRAHSLAVSDSSAGQEVEDDFEDTATETLKALSEQMNKSKEEARNKSRELEKLQKQLTQVKLEMSMEKVMRVNSSINTFYLSISFSAAICRI